MLVRSLAPLMNLQRLRYSLSRTVCSVPIGASFLLYGTSPSGRSDLIPASKFHFNTERSACVLLSLRILIFCALVLALDAFFITSEINSFIRNTKNRFVYLVIILKGICVKGIFLIKIYTNQF